MIVTDDDAIALRLQRLRSHGMTSVTWDRHKGHAWSYDVVDLGYNYRLDEIRAALGSVQLSKLDAYNSRRRELRNLYYEMLEELAPAVNIPFQDHPGVSACHLLPVLLPKATERNPFMDSMKKKGVQTSIHYPPIHQFEAYNLFEQPENVLSLTESVAVQELTLPLFPAMSNADVEMVVNAVKNSL